MNRRGFLTLGASAFAFGLYSPASTWADGTTQHQWKYPGRDPVARSLPEALTKLDAALADAVNGPTQMPQGIADTFRSLILNEHNHATGGPIYIESSTEQHPVVIPMMEFGHEGPQYNIPVTFDNHVKGDRTRSYAMNAYAWQVIDTTTQITWEFGYPLICYNWSVFKKIEQCGCTPPPPGQPSGCISLVVSMHAGSVLYGALVSATALPPFGECTPALKPIGENDFVNLNDHRFSRNCGDMDIGKDQCTMNAPIADFERERKAQVTKYYDFVYQASADGQIQIRIPPSFAISDGTAPYFILCLTEPNGQNSYAKRVGPLDYRPYNSTQRAYVVYVPAEVPPAWEGEVKEDRNIWHFV